VVSLVVISTGLGCSNTRQTSNKSVATPLANLEICLRNTPLSITSRLQSRGGPPRTSIAIRSEAGAYATLVVLKNGSAKQFFNTFATILRTFKNPLNSRYKPSQHIVVVGSFMYAWTSRPTDRAARALLRCVNRSS